MRIPLPLVPRDPVRLDAVGFGLNSIDYLAVVPEFPKPNTKQRLAGFARLPGGQAATAMVACARQGWRTAYVGRFGDDENGTLGLESLRREGVEVSDCETVSGASNQFAVILVESGSGTRTVMWDRHPRLMMMAPDVPAHAVRSGRILLVDDHQTAAAGEAARIARAAGIPTVVDVEKIRPGIEDLLRQIDVIIAAEEFPAAITGCQDLGRALAMMAAEFGSPVVCATLGAQGSLAVAGGREIRTPGFEVPVIDTTGAGDVFRGGFIAGWLALADDPELEAILRHANATAALKCRGLGARSAIPSSAEVKALLAAGRAEPFSPAL